MQTNMLKEEPSYQILFDCVTIIATTVYDIDNNFARMLYNIVLIYSNLEIQKLEFNSINGSVTLRLKPHRLLPFRRKSHIA